MLVSPGAYPKVEQHLKNLQVHYKIASNDLPKSVNTRKLLIGPAVFQNGTVLKYRVVLT